VHFGAALLYQCYLHLPVRSPTPGRSNSPQRRRPAVRAGRIEMIPVEPITAAPLCYSFHNERTMTPLQKFTVRIRTVHRGSTSAGAGSCCSPCGTLGRRGDPRRRRPATLGALRDRGECTFRRLYNLQRIINNALYHVGSRQRVEYRGRTLADRRLGGKILTTVPSTSERPLGARRVRMGCSTSHCSCGTVSDTVSSVIARQVTGS